MIYAITGASGFVGEYLCERLKKHKVIKLRHNKVWHIPKKIDYIIHLASYGNHYNQTDELETVKANYIDLQILLDETKNISYKAFINFSTSSVMLPYQTFYSATKMAGEYLVKAFVDKYNKPVVSIRPGTIFGEGDAPTHLIPTLFRSCLKGEVINFVKEPTHDYIHISDLISGVLTVAKHANKLKGESVEIGNDKPITNDKIRLLIQKITKKKACIDIVQSMRAYDNYSWHVDSGRLRSLGWKPKVSLEKGLRKCYAKLKT